MFKLTKGGSGLRRASARGSSGSGRISGLHGLRGADTSTNRRRLPAFVPEPENHGFDSSNSRLSGLEK